tara:strand:- start:49 stop:696 length:648 start_codon:yes stop_codon:yes gene_type:complete
MKNILNNLLNDTPQEFKELIMEHPHFYKKYGSLIHSAQQSKKDGIWLEFGVFSGETLEILTHFNSKVYGFDSWEGLPEDWDGVVPKGTFDTKGKIPFEPTPKMELIQGWFEDTIPKFIKDKNITDLDFLHLDADLYSSTKCVFDNFKPYFKGKVILTFDEFFGYEGWEGHEYKAFKEFVFDVKDRIIDLKILSYSYNGVNVLGFHPTSFEINFRK